MMTRTDNIALSVLFFACGLVEYSWATPSIRVLTPTDNANLMELATKIETEDQLEQFCLLSATASPSGRQVGVSSLDIKMASGLKEASCVNPFAQHADFSPLQKGNQDTIRSFCAVLTHTSPLHSDSLRYLPEVSDDPNHFQPRPVDAHDKAAFVFLESNPDAHFSWGDQSFPVEKGNMLVFDGSIPHQTVIRKGSVKLLGPFDVETFRQVGPGTSGLPTIPGLPTLALPNITLADASFPWPFLPTDGPNVSYWLIVQALALAAIFLGVLVGVLAGMH